MFCINYSRDYFNKTKNFINEIVLTKLSKQITTKDIIDFDKKINTDDKKIRLIIQEPDIISAYKNIGIYKEIINDYSDINFAIRIDTEDFETFTERLSYIKKLINEKIPIFFDIIIDDWDMLWSFINLGVSDVFIGGDLGFNLQKVKVITDAHDIKVRALPHYATWHWAYYLSYIKFFIRPEDIEFYHNFIDVFDLSLYCNSKDGKKDITEVLLKIYAQDKKWTGDLSELINGLNSPFDSRLIPNHFAKRRVKCGKRCLKDKNCNLCHEISQATQQFEIELTKKMTEKMLEIEKENQEE